jgi:hypothetical protein
VLGSSYPVLFPVCILHERHTYLADGRTNYRLHGKLPGTYDVPALPVYAMQKCASYSQTAPSLDDRLIGNHIETADLTLPRSIRASLCHFLSKLEIYPRLLIDRPR